MTIPHFDRVVFGKAPLRLVIAQVRFPILLRFNEKPFLAPFQKALEAEYPKFGQESQVAIRFSSRGADSNSENLWRFNDREGFWSVVLGEGALTLECRQYTTVDDFLSRFEKLLNAAVKHLGVSDKTRLGFRYINEMRSKNLSSLTGWQEQLNPELTGFAGKPDFLEGCVEHSFQEIQSRRDDGTLVIRHGLLKGTTIESKLAESPPASGPFYLLDLDYFDTTEEPLNISDTIKQLRKYNENIYQFFRWAIDKGRIYSQLEPL